MHNPSLLIFWTFWIAVLSALATGLGALPVYFVKSGSKIMKALSSSIAAGMMISASVFSLAQEGIALKIKYPFAPYSVILGLMLGALFFWFTDKSFSGTDGTDLHLGELGRGLTKKGILIFLAMFIHSIPEGIAIGVGFATGNFNFGLIMAIAIAVHNIPEGIAISLPLHSEGVSIKKCTVISIFSSVPQPVMAVPALLLVQIFEPLLPFGLGFAGGAMIYITMAELIPDALKDGGRTLTAWGVMIGLSGMLLITNLLGLMNH